MPVSAVLKVSAALRIEPRAALALVAGLLAGTVLVVALAVDLDALPLVAILVVGATAAVVSVRWPLVALVSLAVLIPVEEIGTISGFGTLSRLAAVLFAVAYALPRLTTIRVSAMPLAGWAFVGWAIASTVWARDPATSWSELPTLIQLFVIALLVADYVSREPSITRPVLVAYSLSASATAVIAIGSHLAAGAAARAAAIEDQNPAQFAAVLLPAFVFGFNEAVNGGRRFAGSAIALVTLVATVLSGTRGAWVALAIVPLLLLPNLAPRRLLAATLVIVALLAVTIQLPGVASLVTERAGNTVSTGGAGRSDIWSAGLVIYSGAPVLGVGYANFPVAYTPEVVRAANITSAYTASGRAPHNLVVGTLAEVGPIGLILIAVFLLPLAIRPGWGPDARMIRAMMASLLTTAMFLDIAGNRKQVWLVIGLAAGLTYIARRQAADRTTSGEDGEEPPALARGAP